MVNREIIIDTLTGMFAKATVAAWQERLGPAGIPCTPVLTIDQVVRQEQVRARDMIADIVHPEVGSMSLPGVPIKFSEACGGIATPPPLLGEHSKEILLGLGYGADKVDRLVAEAVVGIGREQQPKRGGAKT